MHPNRVYLIGMPASGKTTMGKRLAKKLNYPFIDLDWEIEKKANQNIPAIFEERGEAYFRQLEQEVLKETLVQPAVISTGGGTPCFFDNMDFLLANGQVLLMNIPIRILAQRAWSKIGSRPLLSQAHSLEALEEQIREKWEVRKSYYLRAHFQVNKMSGALPSLLTYLDTLS